MWIIVTFLPLFELFADSYVLWVVSAVPAVLVVPVGPPPISLLLLKSALLVPPKRFYNLAVYS